MLSNRSNGNAFEREFCEVLYSNGFWVHNMAQNQAGQPADVIAIKDNRPFLIDCKDCKNNSFPLKRIEDNQRSAMRLFEKCGNNYGLFALKLYNPDEIYVIMLDSLMNFEYKTGKTVMSRTDIEDYGQPLMRWVKFVS